MAEDKDNDKLIQILITWLLGYLGIHRMMKGYWVSGIVYLCTFGLFSVGYIIDLIYVITDKPLMWQK